VPPARLLFELPISFGSFVPTLDAWTEFPLSVECRLSSQAGEVTLRFRSAVLSSTEAVDAFAPLPLPVTSPVELHLASSFPRISFFGLAGDRSPFPLDAVAPAQPATKLLLLPNFASPATPGVSFPMSLESSVPRLAPRKRISGFHRTFHLPASRKCSFQIATLLPTEVTVG
jgi:hypothetical protein